MDHIPYSGEIPKKGMTLGCDFFIKASEVKIILLFKEGTELNDEDVVRLKKYNDMKVLLIKKEDFLVGLLDESEKLKSALDSNGKIDSKIGAEVSKKFFNSEAILQDDNKLNSMVKMANKFVVDLLKGSKDQRTQALVEILKGLNNSECEFVNHANQVAAVSTMIALMVDNVVIENIIEINLVAILHGIGLMQMSNQKNSFFETYVEFDNFRESIMKTDQAVVEKVFKKHFDGHIKMTTADNIIFFQHLTLIENNMDKVKIKNIKSANVLKTISDLKKILGATDETKSTGNPYISAKILAVGDRLVSLMKFYEKNSAFFETSVKEIQRINQVDKPIYDKDIIEKVALII